MASALVQRLQQVTRLPTEVEKTPQSSPQSRKQTPSLPAARMTCTTITVLASCMLTVSFPTAYMNMGKRYLRDFLDLHPSLKVCGGPFVDKVPSPYPHYVLTISLRCSWTIWSQRKRSSEESLSGARTRCMVCVQLCSVVLYTDHEVAWDRQQHALAPASALLM